MKRRRAGRTGAPHRLVAPDDRALAMVTANMEVRRRENDGRKRGPHERRESKTAPRGTSAGTAGAARTTAHKGAHGEVLAIASGKGGVGKSNIAAGLGILMAAGGAKVALIDADYGAGNLDVLLNVSGGLTLGDVHRDGKELADVLVPVAQGIALGKADYLSRQGQRAVSARHVEVLDGLAGLRKLYDFVILDCGSGVGAEVLDLCGRAGHVLVITTPEPTAMTDAYTLIKLLVAGGYGGRLSTLVNMAASRDEAKLTYARLAGVSSQFLTRTVFDAGHVLSDPNVPAAVKAKKSFVVAHPRCPASRCLAALAVKLWPAHRRIETNKGRIGLMKRLKGWIGNA